MRSPIVGSAATSRRPHIMRRTAWPFVRRCVLHPSSRARESSTATSRSRLAVADCSRVLTSAYFRRRTLSLIAPAAAALSGFVTGFSALTSRNRPTEMARDETTPLLERTTGPEDRSKEQPASIARGAALIIFRERWIGTLDDSRAMTDTVPGGQPTFSLRSLRVQQPPSRSRRLGRCIHAAT